ncbi:Gfo/Idh/MocA family protein [Mesorhizobium sp. NPDC059025]|uniref:Gfo/Idh/MocA family protein n=1 Tax=unclassified Mesorhizobium TaxID=325217 RepID=UPI0036AD96E9
MAIGVGIVGAGFWSKLVHIPSFQKLPGYDLVGIASGHRANADATARETGIRKVYDSYRQLIEDPDIRLVDIVTPNHLHRKIAVAAMEAGKDVIVIKPLATNVADAGAILDAAAKRGRTVFYAENVPFVPSLIAFKALVDQGLYGHIFRLKSMHGVGGPHASWFSDPKQSGGGVIIDMAVHGLAFLQWFAGGARPVSIYADAGTFVHKFPVEDTSVLIVRYDDGKLAQSEDSWSLPGGFDGRYEVYGTSGHGFVDTLYGHPIRSVLGRDSEGGSNAIHYHAVDDHFIKDGHLGMMAHFLDCLENGMPCRSSGEDGLRVMELVDAAYRSVKAGRSIEISSAWGQA